MELKKSDNPESILYKLKAETQGKKLWIDLKGRQLRVKTHASPPYTAIELTHSISVETPIDAYFSGGLQRARVLQVDGNQLIMEDGPRRPIGPGESVNIPHPSLKIDGYFTERDKEYIKAAAKVGLDHFMLSFVEGQSDIDEFNQLYANAMEQLGKPYQKPTIAAKIESRKGIRYALKEWREDCQLMTARGDLYLELTHGDDSQAHDLLKVTERIVGRDPSAIIASRILSSLENSYLPTCSDMSDADNLLRMGYRSLMLGDEICQKRESAISAINCLEAIAHRYSDS